MAPKLSARSGCQILQFQRKNGAGNLVLRSCFSLRYRSVNGSKWSSGDGEVAAGRSEMKGLFCVSFRDFSLFIGVCYPVAGVMGLRRKWCLSKISRGLVGNN